MSPRCPECGRILVGIRATADGPQAQPCDCDLSETVVDELRSPFVDRGRGIATDGGEDIPPARDGEINTIPDVEEGDRVEVITTHGYDSDRTLTVEEVVENGEEPDGLEPRSLDMPTDEECIVLSGYGTTYCLTTVQGLSGAWQRVKLVWQSERTGIPVASVDVVERAASGQEIATDGGTLNDTDNSPWDWQVRGLTARNLYDDAIQEWGADAQAAKASEECAELAAVLSRDLNGQASLEELIQEMVDVRIMLEQLALTFGLSQRELADTVTERLQHLDDRLNGGDSDA